MFLKGLQGVKDEASCCISKSLLAWSSGTASLPIPIFTNINFTVSQQRLLARQVNHNKIKLA